MFPALTEVEDILFKTVDWDCTRTYHVPIAMSKAMLKIKSNKAGSKVVTMSLLDKTEVVVDKTEHKWPQTKTEYTIVAIEQGPVKVHLPHWSQDQVSKVRLGSTVRLTDVTIASKSPVLVQYSCTVTNEIKELAISELPQFIQELILDKFVKPFADATPRTIPRDSRKQSTMWTRGGKL